VTDQSSIWIQLARTGDILNLLPLLYQDHIAGNRRTLMACSEFASVCEGCSYFDTLVYNGPSYDIPGAVEQVEAMGKPWICTQVNAGVDAVKEYVYGPADMDTARTTSFQKEQWRIAGRLKEWDNCYPLVIDKRNKSRETALLMSQGFGKRGRVKPIMLVSTSGQSSPFKHTDLLMELLRGRFEKKYRIIVLPKCERVFDLLALYENAEVLVSTDSAPLHLAWATPKLPVVALVNDKPLLWNGSSWRPNHIFYCRYSDFPERSLDMLKAIESIGKIRTTRPLVVHAWSEYQQKRTVDYGLKWFPLPIAQGMDGRDTGMLGDSKRMPFLKGVLRMAMQITDCEFVCITQPDTGIVDSAPMIVIDHAACFAYRLLKGDDVATFQPMVDLFCARKSWWKAHLDEIPDYVLGRDYWWTHGLRGLFSKYGAVDVTGIVYKIPPATKEPKILPPYPPRIKTNKLLADKYIEDHKICSRYPRVSDQVEVVASFSGMLRNGYNPSIVEHDGKILMALRYHPIDTPDTKLMLVNLDKDFSIISTRPLEIQGDSMEDPRWFKCNGKLFLSWVDSKYPKLMSSVVKYGTLNNETIENIIQPPIAGNDGSTVQKNWVFFEHTPCEAYCIYKTQPLAIFRFLADGEWEELRSRSNPKWSYGTIRGGTPPVPYEDKWLRFFHGNLDNDFGKANRRYYVGAMLMNPEPPFEVVSVSKRPIIYGSEIDLLKFKERPHHWKANVCFPAGVIERNGKWLVSLGINDSSSLIVSISPRELNL